MRKALEKYLLTRWYSDKPIFCLKPLTWLFSKISVARRHTYQKGKKEAYRAPVPVVVVGNITVGGTGKTPVVIFLVEELKKRGYKPAVISRGYGVKVATNQIVTDSLSYEEVGDEPKLIHQRTGVPIAVGRNRKASIELLLKQHPNTDVIISDDGLQHYALQRDIEVVVIDSDRGLGNEALLPAGPLRESKERLNEVDIVLFNGTRFLASEAETINFQLSGVSLHNLRSKEIRLLSDFQGQTIAAFAGIGNPRRFLDELQALGLTVESHFVGDHEQMPDSFFTSRLTKPILMTEKDAVKYGHLVQDNLWYLPVDVVMHEDAKLQLINTILSKIGL